MQSNGLFKLIYCIRQSTCFLIVRSKIFHHKQLLITSNFIKSWKTMLKKLFECTVLVKGTHSFNKPKCVSMEWNLTRNKLRGHIFKYCCCTQFGFISFISISVYSIPSRLSSSFSTPLQTVAIFPEYVDATNTKSSIKDPLFDFWILCSIFAFSPVTGGNKRQYR